MSPTDAPAKAAIGHDDYSLTRVPVDARYSWVSVAFQRFGQLSALAQFFLAAMIGLRMDFWPAMLAITIGAVLLEIVTIFVGLAGQREGLSTSLLGRWTGFGVKGSALVGIAIALSLTGWFAVQNGVFAAGMATLIPSIPFAVWALVGGIVVTIIVVYGFKWMNYVAYVTVPAFIILCIWALSATLSKWDLGKLMTHDNPALVKAAPLDMAGAITIVAGGFIVGALFTPDMSRFNRRPRDVVYQTIVGVTLGEYFVAVVAVLLAHTMKGITMEQFQQSAGTVVHLISTATGWVGVIILILSIIKINDWNLYPSTLGITNSVDALIGTRWNRVYVAMVLGLFGSILSAAGFADFFQPFLIELGTAFPPIAAIMIVDYFILKTWRPELDASRENGFKLPSLAPDWVAGGLIAWLVGYAVSSPMLLGKFVSFGVPSINSLVVGGVVYWLLAGPLGLNGKKGAKRVADTL